VLQVFEVGRKADGSNERFLGVVTFEKGWAPISKRTVPGETCAEDSPGSSHLQTTCGLVMAYNKQECTGGR